jgi:arginine/lysine/ornithine decarboxylase
MAVALESERYLVFSILKMGKVLSTEKNNKKGALGDLSRPESNSRSSQRKARRTEDSTKQN